jgi:hypothetical protein
MELGRVSCRPGAGLDEGTSSRGGVPACDRFYVQDFHRGLRRDFRAAWELHVLRENDEGTEPDYLILAPGELLRVWKFSVKFHDAIRQVILDV